MTIYRKTPRLRAEKYLGQQTCFITICCDGRLPHLREPNVASTVRQSLLQCAAQKSFLIHAYCLMPDHLHVLVKGTADHSDLLELIRLFKQRTAFTFRKATGKRLWEMGFYDYILRSSDTIESIAAYIWWNPVRRGICKEPRDFPFSGSQTITWLSKSTSHVRWTPPWFPGDRSKKNGSEDPPLRIAGHRERQ